jgi:hypothetical protein
MGRQKRLTNELRRVLETGSDALGYFSPRLSPEELRERLREPWRRFGARVTRDYAKRRPGRRPACWWWYDAPEPRPVAPEPGTTPAVRDWTERDLFQALLDQCFLIQHGLLTATEKEALARELAESRRLLENMAEEGERNLN